jgi:hypothetical protein
MAALDLTHFDFLDVGSGKMTICFAVLAISGFIDFSSIV